MAKSGFDRHGPWQDGPAGCDPEEAKGHNPGDRDGLTTANALFPPGLGPRMIRSV